MKNTTKKTPKKKKIIVANWKTNPQTPELAIKLFKKIHKKATAVSHVETVICPPALFSGLFLKEKFGPKIRLGAQNVFHKEQGSCTGEVSASMLKASKVSYIIIGHSERRNLGDTDALIAQKVALATREGFKAILCIGESEHDSEGKYLDFLAQQIKTGLSLVQKTDLLNVVIAYEPLSAIGASQPMTGYDIHQTVLYIKKVLRDLYNETIADAIPVLYGGSVNAGNIYNVIGEGNVDGVLVGRDSLNPENFGDIITYAATH